MNPGNAVNNSGNRLHRRTYERVSQIVRKIRGPRHSANTPSAPVVAT
jgi:hypothetical protein